MKPNWRDEVDPVVYDKAVALCTHEGYTCDPCLKKALLDAEKPPWQSRWLEFVEIKDTGKTKVWSVRNRENGFVLGQVKWYGGFRKYAFFPVGGTIYDPPCLYDVAHFMQTKMNERKNR